MLTSSFGENMDNKTKLRQQARAMRKSLGPSERSEKSKAICEKLLGIIENRKAKNIFAYIAVGSEASLHSLIEALEKSENEYIISFPGAMENGEMKALMPFSKFDFKLSSHGINAPEEKRSIVIKAEELDIVLVPLLLFDADKNRLGQGGGYYDRYLPKAKSALKIGVAFEAQRYAKLPREPHDFPLDIIVTEDKLWL